MPLLIKQTSSFEYGILVTLISITTWFTFVDFGLANGLKNLILESAAKNDIQAVKKYISTAYFALLKIILCLSLTLILCNFFINWNYFIKGPDFSKNSVNDLFFYGLLFFLARIFFDLINPILLAYHRISVSSFISFISQFAILAVCYYYKSTGSHFFFKYGFAFFWVPLVVLLSSNVFFYLTAFKTIRPSVKFIEKEIQKSLLKLGSNFFIIQIAVLIVFTTDNLIIGRILGYNEVSNYNIAFRYFNIPIFILTIILSPYWPIFGEYYIKNDLISIKKTMNHLLLLWLLVALLSIAMLMLSQYVYRIWISPNITLPFALNIGMCSFSIISGWNSVFATFINSTSKLRLQLYGAVFTGIINIPLSVYLAKYTSLGAAGVIFGTCLCLLTGSIWAPLQYYKLVNNKAKGIWNR